MKFLFRSSDGLCLPQCLRVKAEGNQVKLSIADKGFDNQGDGFVDKSVNFDAAVGWADVVVYDVKEGLGEEADRVRKRKPTVGACGLGEQLEHDRKLGMDVARQVGIRCPEVSEFSGPAAFERAREFLRSKDRSIDWVLKCNGKVPNGVGSFVSKDGRAGALRMLKHWETLYKGEGIRPDFVICKRIDGAEISTEAWFNGIDFILPNHTLERTKFFPGDLGEKVGCCGNVVWALDQDAPLFRKLLDPIRPMLVGRFCGPLDCNVIIEKGSGEPMFLEWSPRFGYDAVFALMELMQSDFGEFLAGIARGQQPNYRMDEGFAGDVRITIPPFPAKAASERDDEAVGVPIFGLAREGYSRHRHLVEVMYDIDNQLVTSGPHGFVMSVTGTGENVRDAQAAAYRELDSIHIPNMRYRNDLEESIGEMYDKAEATGWLSDGASAAKPMGVFAAFQQHRGKFPNRLRG